MSGIDLAKRQSWCATAKSLLDLKGTSAATPNAAKAKLTELRALGRAVELADDEWATLDDALSSAEKAMKQGDAQKRPGKPLPGSARFAFEAAVGAANDAAQIIERRQKDFDAAVTPDLTKLLKADAATKLRSNKKLLAVCAEATRLIKEAQATSSQFASIKDYGDPAEANDQRAAFDESIGELDLILAEDWLGKMKTTLQEAADEKAQVEKLQKLHSSASDAPTTIKDWRTLADCESRFAVVKSEIPRAIGEAEESTLKSKTDQVESLKGPVLKAIADWPAKSITEKCNAHAVGSVTWLEERLDRLLAPTVDEAKVAAAREAREWDAFVQDVAKQWRAFVDSGYAAAFRGPFAPRRLQTASVKAKCKGTNTFSTSGRTFTKASSDTSGVSYHTPLDPPFATNAAGQEIRSFIYHI